LYLGIPPILAYQADDLGPFVSLSNFAVWISCSNSWKNGSSSSTACLSLPLALSCIANANANGLLTYSLSSLKELKHFHQQESDPHCQGIVS